MLTDLQAIAALASEKEEENHHFFLSLRHHNGALLDERVHVLNKEVSAAVDCTACGNCCRTLVINITSDEITGLAAFLGKTEQETRETYIEESLQGNCFINSVPCHFLEDSRCSIYTQRFTECRDFPHLHKPGFRERALGTLGHYGRCPIIFNVVEQLKRELGFLLPGTAAI